ncbi:MAG: plasmid pRiA4b ORF-3 family protein [Candidatus Vogelbacteria bacterium]
METKSVYQFKISLNYSKPLIWRRIQVPATYTFWELHCAIQDAMGWSGGHLHGFMFANKKNNWQTINIMIPSPDNDEFMDRIVDERTAKVADYFEKISKQCKYEYDFGDGWVHTILLEKVVPIVSGEKYPKCLAGKRACPPDDCGGIGGYERLIDILKQPKHPEHKETMEWLGLDFPNDLNPEHFDANEVEFGDPKELLKEFEDFAGGI